MSSSKPEIKLGKVQLHIMQFLWEKGQATAREISDHLSEQHSLSHSTIQSLLRKLEKKGAIQHSERERVFLFSPVAKQDEVTVSTTREFLNRVFQGSASGLVSHILEHEKFSKDELDQLRQLIDAHREKTL
jgi:predicted transcriptional regulator